MRLAGNGSCQQSARTQFYAPLSKMFSDSETSNVLIVTLIVNTVVTSSKTVSRKSAKAGGYIEDRFAKARNRVAGWQVIESGKLASRYSATDVLLNVKINY